MPLTVYLNGQFLPYEQASLPIEDRSFLFADGVYEVIRVYGGQPFLVAEHLTRLTRSAGEIRLPIPDLAEVRRALYHLITLNSLSEASIYLQVSRGSYDPRTHAFPVGPVRPLILMIARPAASMAEQRTGGAAAITVPEQRWARCDIKSVSLLANVLAKQQAAEAGAYEAIFVRDGFAVEGSSSNLFAVQDGAVVTYPLCSHILGGITRMVVLKLARELGYTVREEGIRTDTFHRCPELWITSTMAEIMPIVTLDGRAVGDGRPGPVMTALQKAYRKLV